MLSLGVCGCTSVSSYVGQGFKVGPSYERPAAPVANDWIDAKDERIYSGSEEHARWWAVFGDPVLDSLIQTAYRQNLSLKEAGWCVQEARALYGAALGGWFPQTQQLQADYTRSQRSLLTANAAADPTRTLLGPRALSNYRLAGQVAWELDFWGRFRRQIETAGARFDATVEDYDNALVILLAETALAYVDIRTLQQRIEYARENVRIQRQSTSIAVARKEEGEENSELDAPQAESNLAQTEALLVDLDIALRQAQNRLAVLLGMPPQNLDYLLRAGPIPRPPASVAAGVPAELLRRRPDVLSAERELAARSAEIGIAVSRLYPQITINGSLALEAESFNQLFNNRAWTGNIGPGFRWDILNYGRLLMSIEAADARFQQQLFRYQQTVLTANQEAEDAIVAFLRLQEQVELLARSVRKAEEAVDIATAKYESGLVDFNRLFTLQQFLVGQQDQLATARGNLAQSLIQLYRALAGGWQIRLAPPPAPAVIYLLPVEEVPLPVDASPDAGARRRPLSPVQGVVYEKPLTETPPRVRRLPLCAGGP